MISPDERHRYVGLPPGSVPGAGPTRDLQELLRKPRSLAARQAWRIASKSPECMNVSAMEAKPMSYGNPAILSNEALKLMSYCEDAAEDVAGQGGGLLRG